MIRILVPWIPEARGRIVAFKNCKEELMQVTTLTHPAPSVFIILTYDVSDLAGALLEQIINEVIELVAFFSRIIKFFSTFLYNTYNRELLGIYLAIKHFRYILEGRRIINRMMTKKG